MIIKSLAMFTSFYSPLICFTFLTIGLIHLTACQPSTSPKDISKARVTDNAVILDKNYVITVKPERYQPSFRLEGVLAPIAQATLHLPENATLQTLHVMQGDTVKKGDKIATFFQVLLISPPVDQNTDDLQHNHLDHLATDQIHQIPNLQSSSTQPASATTDTIINNIAIITPISGKVQKIFINNEKIFHQQGMAVATIVNDERLRFVSLLPTRFAEHIRIGDAVNFNTADGRHFSGQISKVMPDPKTPNTLDIFVHIRTEEIKRAKLTIGKHVSGYVEYGQMSVGTLVPATAIFDNDLQSMSLEHLKKPPHKPATPIHAFLWAIGQDEKLSLLSIEVIEYFPSKDQYLISGVALDGLIVVAHLPKQAQGKRVRLK